MHGDIPRLDLFLEQEQESGLNTFMSGKSTKNVIYSKQLLVHKSHHTIFGLHG